MSDRPPPAEDARARAGAFRRAIAEQIQQVYVGAPETTELLLVALLARGHALVEGLPGIAKTTLVKAFAGALGCSFRRIQFTPDLLPADITGTYVLNMQTNAFELRRGPIFAQVVLGDEINRAPAKTQSALLEAMAEAQVTVEGQTLRLEPPFMVLATQNPIEQEGVYPLPEAQVDRFAIKLELGYPSLAAERRVLETYDQPPPAVCAATGPEEILSLADAASQVHVASELRDYIIQLARFTREHPAVLHGASPRASLTLLRAGKARALLHERDHLLPDDVRALAAAVYTHRIQLTPEAELDGTQAREVVAEALEQTRWARL